MHFLKDRQFFDALQSRLHCRFSGRVGGDDQLRRAELIAYILLRQAGDADVVVVVDNVVFVAVYAVILVQ